MCRDQIGIADRHRRNPHAKLCLLAGCCVAAFSQTVLVQDARATASGDSVAYPEILVTAQRRSQRLQEVPIAVSAFKAR